jgi:hypothetical protein
VARQFLACSREQGIPWTYYRALADKELNAEDREILLEEARAGLADKTTNQKEIKAMIITLNVTSQVVPCIELKRKMNTISCD